MCCEPSGFKEEEINGKCPDCGEPTIDNMAYDKCHWSPVDCDTCGRAGCDGSC